MRMLSAKRLFKLHTHNAFFKVLAGFGRSLNRLYENRNHDPYSNGERRVIRILAGLKPSVIIDGGANAGNYSLLLNRFNPGCTIYAFEPVDSTFQLLTKNVKEYNTIIPVRKGLYRANCSEQIHVFRSSEHASLVDIRGLADGPVETQTIELLRGDDFMKANDLESVDFLKLDIEGAEYDALTGFEDSIRNGKIKAIQFEYGYINISTKKLLIDYYAFFEAYGYVVGKIFPKTVEFRKYAFKHEDFIGPNFIAVKKSETNLIGALINVKN